MERPRDRETERPRDRETASGLLEPLRDIAQAQGQDRERLLRQLVEHASKFSAAWVRGRARKAHAFTKTGVQELATHALEQLVLVTLAGRVPFRGSTEAEATAWCRAVVRNATSDELRRRRRYRDGQRGSSEALEPGPPADVDGPPEELIEQAMAALETEVLRATRADCAATVRRSFRFFIADQLGAAVTTLGPAGSPESHRRQRILQYQWRRRGKLAAERAYARLAARGMDKALQRLLLALLGLETDERGLAAPASRTTRGCGNPSPGRLWGAPAHPFFAVALDDARQTMARWNTAAKSSS